ncbi:hypothetical protein Adt_12300 [Abeliophyllum distichum]|uniref:Uncharacterized protein n=1 Tax=Abeliophyllum distichum TaxID=126358 RepID=A0ABD1UQC4_9LAMI
MISTTLQHNAYYNVQVSITWTKTLLISIDIKVDSNFEVKNFNEDDDLLLELSTAKDVEFQFGLRLEQGYINGNEEDSDKLFIYLLSNEFISDNCENEVRYN